MLIFFLFLLFLAEGCAAQCPWREGTAPRALDAVEIFRLMKEGSWNVVTCVSAAVGWQLYGGERQLRYVVP